MAHSQSSSSSQASEVKVPEEDVSDLHSKQRKENLTEDPNSLAKMKAAYEREISQLVRKCKKGDADIRHFRGCYELQLKTTCRLNDEISQLKKQYSVTKYKCDQEKAIIQKQVEGVREQLLQLDVHSKTWVTKMKTVFNILRQISEDSQQEVKKLQAELDRQTLQCTILTKELGVKTVELEDVTNKLKNIQVDRNTCNDLQQYSKASTIKELDQKLKPSIAPGHSLQEEIENKASWERQLSTLIDRNKALKVKIEELKQYLEMLLNIATGLGIKPTKCFLSVLECAGRAIISCYIATLQMAALIKASQQQANVIKESGHNPQEEIENKQAHMYAIIMRDEDIKVKIEILKLSLEQWVYKNREQGMKLPKPLLSALECATTAAAICSETNPQIAALTKALTVADNPQGASNEQLKFLCVSSQEEIERTEEICKCRREIGQLKNRPKKLDSVEDESKPVQGLQEHATN